MEIRSQIQEINIGLIGHHENRIILKSVLRLSMFQIAFLFCFLIITHNSFAQSPTIVNFSPASGPIGTTITINGTNFDTTPSKNIVQFNGTTANVTASTISNITTIVPAGTTTGTITVKVGANTATSSSNFTVTPHIPLGNVVLMNGTTDYIEVPDTYYVSIKKGNCESSRTPVIATIQVCNPPKIASTVVTAFIEGIVTINLTNLISDADGNIDPSTLIIATQPSSGAKASLSGFILTIDYTGVPFVATEIVGLQICDLTKLCTSQNISIELAGDINVYNAVSPNGDGKNEFLYLQYIDVIPTKQVNKVSVFNRWGDEVFSISNYNNTDRRFNGLTNDGSKLPAGTYFYKIYFDGESPRTGYLELKY